LCCALRFARNWFSFFPAVSDPPASDIASFQELPSAVYEVTEISATAFSLKDGIESSSFSIPDLPPVVCLIVENFAFHYRRPI
jgi:hypothetical protein